MLLVWKSSAPGEENKKLSTKPIENFCPSPYVNDKPPAPFTSQFFIQFHAHQCRTNSHSSIHINVIHTTIISISITHINAIHVNVIPNVTHISITHIIAISIKYSNQCHASLTHTANIQISVKHNATHLSIAPFPLCT